MRRVEEVRPVNVEQGYVCLDGGFPFDLLELQILETGEFQVDESCVFHVVVHFIALPKGSLQLHFCDPTIFLGLGDWVHGMPKEPKEIIVACFGLHFVSHVHEYQHKGYWK